jgi:hypothetical protein
MSSMKALLEQSNCHTLDRNDFRAQRDKCGVGQEDPLWDDTASKQFNVHYWPYVQDKTVKDCIELFFSDSVTNLKKTHG